MSRWKPVCPLARVPAERGVAALLDGEQVALFRTRSGGLHAVQNRDPFSGAMVLSRGVVGSRGERDVVASPMYKQSFDLATGQCLDDPAVVLRVYPVRVEAGTVQVDLDGVAAAEDAVAV